MYHDDKVTIVSQYHESLYFDGINSICGLNIRFTKSSTDINYVYVDLCLGKRQYTFYKLKNGENNHKELNCNNGNTIQDGFICNQIDGKKFKVL